MFKCTLCGIELQKKYMLGHFVSKTHAKKKKEYNLKLPEHQTINEDLSKLDEDISKLAEDLFSSQSHFY